MNSALADIYKSAFGGRFDGPQMATDCNVRFSVTSPSPEILNALAGEITIKQFVHVTQTTAHFHAHVLKEGRGVIYEMHTGSIAAGLASYGDDKRIHHLNKNTFPGWTVGSTGTCIVTK